MIKRMIGTLVIFMALIVALYFGVWHCFLVPVADIITILANGNAVESVVVMDLAKICVGLPLCEMFALFVAFFGFMIMPD